MIKIIFNILNYLVTIVLSAGVVISLLSTTISPVVYGWMPYFSLSAPLLVVLMVFMMLLNMILTKPLALLPLIVFIASLFRLDSQFNLPFTKEYAQENEKIMVVSQNVRLFRDSKWNNVMDSIVNQMLDENARIITFQEFPTDEKLKEKVLEKLNRYYVAISDFEDNNGKYPSLAIFARYPIVNRGSNMQDSLNSGYSWVDLVMKKDTVRVYNLHLKSNVITKVERQSMMDNDSFKRDSVSATIRERCEKMSVMLKRFRKNSQVRAIQADTISQEIAKSPYPVIVCGDFNDVPFSYTFNTIKSELNDSFEKVGSGYGYSFNELFRLLKIDYILYSDYFRVISYKSPLSIYSDHNPLYVELAIDK